MHGSGEFSEESDCVNSELFANEDLYNFLSKEIWPSFFKSDGRFLEREAFDKNISKILQLDIRSLYPTAQTLKQPVLNPILFSTCLKEDGNKMANNHVMKKNGICSLNAPCQNVRNSEKNEELFVVPVNHHSNPYHRLACVHVSLFPRFEEYYASRYELKTNVQPYLNDGYQILTVAGASFVGKYFFIST